MEEETNNTPPPAEQTPAPSMEKKAEVPAKFTKIVEQIETLTVLELNELVKVFEDRFGVSAASFASAAPAAGGDGAGDDDAGSLASVELTAAGDSKIQVIKAVKEILALGLKEAKDMVDGAPVMIKEGISKDDAKVLKEKLEAAGAKATIK